MNLLNPKKETYIHLDEDSKDIMLKTIDFFENKGKEKLKEDFHQCVFYDDFIEFQKKHQIFYRLLTPKKYGDGSTRWDTLRNCYFNEILGFYGLVYWYTWQVTILGLGPIWMGDNEDIKKETAEYLKNGGIFAFGLSEQDHGADIYSTSMSLKKIDQTNYIANGKKYYIGNANKAALVSTFAKLDNDYVFFVVKPDHKNYNLIKNVVNSQSYVAEYELIDYPITEKDILSKKRDAWDASLNTVNVGKFNLGLASIGITTHSFYEALNHASKRKLFDHYVTDFTHIKQLFLDSYTKLIAMKLFAFRGADYIRAANKDDRRYLLYTPMVKMKVTTQGEEVVNLLADIIAAKGFEKDTYFEMAQADIRALPKLEGTVHVNMALIIKFMKNYFFKPKKFDPVPKMVEKKSDEFLFNQGETRGLSKIRFHDYKSIYNSVSLKNVNIFKRQIRLLKLFLVISPPSKKQIKDFDFLLNLGELFTLVVYGQLIIENAKINKIDDILLNQIFNFLVRDFSKYALNIYLKSVTNKKQKFLSKKMIKKPNQNEFDYKSIINKIIYSLKDQYEMTP